MVSLNRRSDMIVAALAAALSVAGASAAASDFIRDTNIPKFHKTDRPQRRGHDEGAPPSIQQPPEVIEFDAGSSLFKAGRYAEALPHLQFAAERSPANVKYQWWLADCLARLGRREEAVRRLDRVLSSPNLSADDRSGVTAAKREIEEAIAQARIDAAGQRLDEMRGAQNVESRNAANHAVDKLLAKQNLTSLEDPANDPMVVDARGPKPLAEFIKAVPELADSPAAESARKGLAAAANGDWNAAWAWYGEAVRRDPGNPVLRRALERAAWAMKHSRRAGPVAPSAAAKALLSAPTPLARAGDVVRLYGEIATDIGARSVESDWEQAERDRLADELRRQAAEAQMFTEAVRSAKDSGRH